MREIKRAMERVREKPDESEKLRVSNWCPHNVNIGKAFYRNQYPHKEAIRVGDIDARRNPAEVEGLPFPILERVVPSRESVIMAARQILEDRADVVIVSAIVIQALHELERNEKDEQIHQTLRRALARIISPSLGKNDIQRGNDNRVTGADCAFAHPLFLDRWT